MAHNNLIDEQKIKLKTTIMNKIERAIYDTKLYIKDAEREQVALLARIKALKETLDTLESINNDKHTPHDVIKQKG